MNKEELLLWPDAYLQTDRNDYPHPDYAEQQWHEGPEWGGGVCVKEVCVPTLTVYHPQQPNGCALILCPGGGYNMLCLDREGHVMAQRFAGEGITTAVLKYRHFDQERAWHDAHRAVRLMRHHADDWHVDTDKIGIGGFSAGGHLSAHCSTRQENTGQLADEIEALSGRPDYMLLIYAALRMQGKVHLHKECIVDAQTPPAFIVHGANDQVVDVMHSVRFFNELQAAGVSSELHVYQDGKHGFDHMNTETAQGLWPDMFVHWLRTNEFID